MSKYIDLNELKNIIICQISKNIINYDSYNNNKILDWCIKKLFNNKIDYNNKYQDLYNCIIYH